MSLSRPLRDRRPASAFAGGQRSGAGFARVIERLSPTHQRIMATLISRLGELEQRGDEAGALRLIEDVRAMVLAPSLSC